MAVDLRAAFLVSKAAVPVMKANGGGRIINFSDWLSVSGRPRYPGYLTYYVAKTGVKALTEAIALEVARRSDSRERHRAWPHLAAAGHVSRRARSGRESRRRWGDGEVSTRSPRR